MSQGDQSAPVYGWRPFNGWQVGEIVHDVYPLARQVERGTIDYGLYRQLADGSFVNDYTYSIEVDCS